MNKEYYPPLIIGGDDDGPGAAARAVGSLTRRQFRLLIDYASAHGTRELMKAYDAASTVSGDPGEADRVSARDDDEDQPNPIAPVWDAVLSFLCRPDVLTAIRKAVDLVKGRPVHKYLAALVVLLWLYCRHRDARPSRPAEAVHAAIAWARSNDDRSIGRDLSASEFALYIIAKASVRNVARLAPSAVGGAGIDRMLAQAEPESIVGSAYDKTEVAEALGEMLPTIYDEPLDNSVVYATALTLATGTVEETATVFDAQLDPTVADITWTVEEAVYFMQRLMRGSVDR